MITQAKWMAGVVVLVLIFFGIYFSSSDSNKLEEEVLRIGAVEALSGNAAYYGESTRRGVEIAQSILKEKYPGISLEVFHQDSFYTPKGGVEAYQTLRTQHDIDAVITHGSPIALAVQPLAKEDQILQMAVSGSVADYSSPNDLSFRTSAVTDLEVTPMAEYIRDQNYRRLAILYFQNDIGVSIKDSLINEVERVSPTTEVVIEEGFLIDATDFRTLLSKVKLQNTDAVYVAGLASNIANILNQAQELGVDVDFLGFRASEDPALIQNAPETAEGFVYTYNFDPQDDNQMVRDFVERFREQHTSDPDGYAAEGYLGLMLTVEAFVECGKDYVCIQEYLMNLDSYPSIFGPLTFDENGDIFYDFFLKTVEGGQFVRLENN